MLIDGKKISQEMGDKMFVKNASISTKLSLGILCVGKDKASLSFINVKKRFGEKYGFSVNLLNLDENSGLTKIKKALLCLQSENDAVLVQLPLPISLREHTDEVLSLIEKNKDVDGLNNGNFEAPIVLALENIINFVEKNSQIKFSEKKICIIGLGQVVGMPIKKYLENKKYIVDVIKKGELEKIKKYEVVISGVGSANLIKAEDISSRSILIDYGCSYVLDEFGNEKIFGDFDASCFSKSVFYTPVPGCMGPLVVANIFKNILNKK